MVLVAVVLALQPACSEGDVHCRPGVCPTGYTCDRDGKGCVVAGGGEAAGALPGAFVQLARGHDGGTFLATYDLAIGALGIGRVAADSPLSLQFPDGAGSSAGNLPPAARDTGTYPSIAVGPDDTPAVAYYAGADRELRFAEQIDGIWMIETIDGEETDAGRFASLAFDDAGRPHVAYYDATRRVLRYATRIDGDWRRETVPIRRPGSTTTGGAGYGEYASLGLSVGLPAIAFYDAIGGDLYVAVRSGDGWQALLLDGRDAETNTDLADVGRHASLAVTPGGDIAVAYYDRTHGTLRYAEGRSGELRVEVVDDGRTDADGLPWVDCIRHAVGQSPALAVDATGRARIVYFDATDLTLRMAVREGRDTWRRLVVDSRSGAGIWSDQVIAGSTSIIAYARLDVEGSPAVELNVDWVVP